MTGYYEAKRQLSKASAKAYLDQREVERSIKQIDERAQRSRVWLDKFRAAGRASRTGFDWRPKIPWAPNTGAEDGEETKVEEAGSEAAGQVMADADAPSDGRGESGPPERGDDPADGSGEAAPAGSQAFGSEEVPDFEDPPF